MIGLNNIFIIITDIITVPPVIIIMVDAGADRIIIISYHDEF